MALGVSDASAATINVGETSTGTGAVTIEDDGICSITEAIQNANNTSGTPVNVDCVAGGIPDGAGGAADDIILPNNSTFTFDGINPSTFPGDGQNALPLITSNINIEGNGSVLERMEDPLPPGAPIPDFRIINTNGNLTLNNLTLRNGSTLQSGGCITAEGTLSLNNSEISGCNSQNTGGGILIFDTNASITNSVISGNTATSFGGGIYNISSASNLSFNLINSTVSGNITQANGGGISVYSSIYTSIINIVNSTITNNIAEIGSGLDLFFSDINIRNSIISGNNLINGSINNCFIFSVSNFNDLGNNLSNDNTCGFTSPGSFDNDCLGPLTNNGGPTLTHALIESNTGTCSTNLAIDGGDNATCAGPEVNNQDQRGVMRPIDGGGVNGAQCDIGSFEFQPLSESGICSMTEFFGDGVDNNGDGNSN